jgi:trans-aconitate methyltransferase
LNEPGPFEFDAGKYRQSARHQTEWGAKLIAELNLRGDERILDLGCGDGVVTAQLAELVPSGEVVGIDSSQNMIAAAQTVASNRLSFRRLDINDLDYEAEFDLIFSNATLHWVKDHCRLLNNVRRAMRTNGACRFNFAADGNCSNFFRVVRELIQSPTYAPFFIGFEWPWFMPRLEEYESLFVGGIFREYRVWGENADREFANAEAMAAWIDQPSLVPFLVQLNGASKQEFRDKAVERMLQLTKRPGGRQFEAFRRINVLAKT